MRLKVRRPIRQLSALMLCFFTTGAPALHLVRQELALYVRTAVLQRELHILDAALDVGFTQRLGQRIAETIDHSAWRASSRERASPGVGLEKEHGHASPIPMAG